MHGAIIDVIFIFGAKYLFVAALAVVAGCFFALPQQRKKEMVFFAVVTLPVAYLAAKIAGMLYFDPRPFAAGHFVPLIPHVADNGFPSDHALLTFSVAFLLYPFNKKGALITAVFAVLVGISRVYVGVHHPVDIIGSAVIAGAVAAVVAWRMGLMRRADAPVFA